MTRSNNPDILLVAMPFTLIRWPSLSLGLLKSILVEGGIRCGVVYGNLLFADQVGLDAFLFAENGWTQTFLCDWLFQRKLFPDAAFPAEKFVETHLNGKNFAASRRSRAAAILEELRRRSEVFLDDLVESMIERRPGIVGCSLTVVQLFSSLALFKEIKKRAPGIMTLAGGPACEGAPGVALHRHFPQMDFLFSGDGDKSIVPVCKALLAHGTALKTQAAPPGLITPEHRNTRYPSPPPRVRFDDLDQNPLPDHGDFFDALARTRTVKKRLHPAVPFEGSRGCWWGERSLCHFCGDCGMYPKYRTKSGDRLLNELIRSNERYGVTRFVATDNVVNPALFKAFFPKLSARKRDWRLFFEIRSSIKKREAQALREAGVTYVQAGIENLHTQSLMAMNKGVRSWQNIQCLKWCRQYGISISWFIITRFPGEDDAWNSDQARLIPLLTHLQPPRSVGIVRPDRHSPYVTRDIFEKKDIDPKPAYHCFFKDQAAARDFVFHIHDRKLGSLLADPLENLVRPGRKDVMTAVARWWKVFVGDPPPVLVMEKEGHRISVTDTRPVAVDKRHFLTYTQARILGLAEKAPKTADLRRLAVQENLGTNRLEPAIQDLMDRYFLIERDGRFISLVLDAPVTELPLERNLPVGWIEGEDRIQAANPLACDAFWQLTDAKVSKGP
jgi:ribosomal peptide maturation radical SAM protein 1